MCIHNCAEDCVSSAREVAYAVYEYFCEASLKGFEKILSFHEYEETKITSPNCGTDKVHQLMATFTAVTSNKS